MKLFKTEQIQKYWGILNRLERSICARYTEKNKTFCAREVFVRRTLNKWLKNKLLVLYTTSEQTGLEYKRYISIQNVKYALHHSTELQINIYDYSRPMDIWEELVINHNEALDLEGEWVDNADNHNTILKLSYLDLPEKEYVFEAYDFSKYPKRRKKGQSYDDIRESLKTTISFKAKTEKEAYKKRKEYYDSDIENKLMVGELKQII